MLYKYSVLLSARNCSAYVSCMGIKRQVLYLKGHLLLTLYLAPACHVFQCCLTQLFIVIDCLEIMNDACWFQLTFIKMDDPVDLLLKQDLDQISCY